MTYFIDVWHNWRERRNFMRDVRRESADAREWAYYRFRDAMIEARSALEGGHTRRAAQIWIQACEQYPGQARGSNLVLELLIGLSRFDEADLLMKEGQAKKPGDARFAVGLAHIARARGDHELAAQRWAFVRKTFPNVIEGFTFGAQALRELKLLSDAEALTLRTMKRFPNEVIGFMEYANLAQTQQNWEQALQRWEVVRLRFDHLSGYTGAGQALVELARYDEAAAIYNAGRMRYPTEPAAYFGLAKCAEAQGDVNESINRWKDLAQRLPMHILSVLECANALEDLGARPDAEGILHEAIDHFIDDPRPAMALGDLLLRKHEFSAAAGVFASARATFPNEEVLYVRNIEALLQAANGDKAEALQKEYSKRFKQ